MGPLRYPRESCYFLGVKFTGIEIYLQNRLPGTPTADQKMVLCSIPASSVEVGRGRAGVAPFLQQEAVVGFVVERVPVEAAAAEFVVALELVRVLEW